MSSNNDAGKDFRDNLMTDAELDYLLSHASAPPLPGEAKVRLLARLEAAKSQAAPATIVQFRKADPQRSRLGWLAGLPLAASLALGIYLGSAGQDASLLPAAAYDVLSWSNGEEPLTGIEEAESLAEEEMS